MKIKLLFLLILISSSAFSQVTFEEGYYVNNSGIRLPILIKFLDWKNNPSQITYKRSPTSDEAILDPNSAREFGIDGVVKYVRATVPVDISNHDLKNLSNNAAFESEEKTVFLKTLVDGKADLFSLKKEGMQQFFFRMDEETIQALVFKRYIPEFSIKIHENNHFRQQLFNVLQCQDIDQNEIQRTSYEKTDLVKLFREFNSCKNSEVLDFTAEVKNRDAFNLRIRPGVQYANLSMNTYVERRSIEFGTRASIRLGLEGEYILPFFRNKWSFFVEPTYQSYKSEAVFPEQRYEDGTVSVNYQSLEVPFGVRHYFFLNSDNKIFINLAYTADFLLGDSRFDFETVTDTYHDTKLETNTGTNFSFGGGYSYRDFNIEGRYNFNRTLTGKESATGTSYNSFSVILGYQFL